MTDSAVARLAARARAAPSIAASGGLALLVLAGAGVALSTFVGPTALPDPGGRRLGTAILATMVGVGLLWLLVVARGVWGVATYLDGGDRPTGLNLALAVVEGVVAAGMLAVAGVAVALSDTAGGAEALAVGAYVVAAVGLGLALASAARAGVALLSPA
ncbi:hypothetical protein [Halobaculum litoreum]|uniref:hypothetical protein n=1 Tax=Halobaculum litoreum TaxID=3031998 RepID=UPI0024C3B6CC|nr:hypothetical protein [Halobaculum sp. DT92]